jgi:acyl dehydratase
MPPPPPPPPHHDDDWYHPWGTAAVIGATAVTAIAIGTAVASVPRTCVPVLVNGISYQQCGSTWYQPQYIGTTLQYVVVGAPR